MRSIWFNGLVYTGKEALQTAFLAEDGIFRAVGSDAEILALADEGTVCEDLKGQFVCPGFNDSHMHLLGYGQALKGAQLAEHTDSLAELFRYLKEYAAENPLREGRWLTGRGWNQDYFQDVSRMPDRHDLDEVSTDFPILIMRACGHACAVNSRALEIAGITETTPSPEGGLIGFEGGEPDGRLYDNAIELVKACVPSPDKEDLKEMIRLACRQLNRYGVTSSQTDDYCVFRSIPFETVNAAYRELEAAGELTCRVYEQSNFTTPGELARFVEAGNVTGAGTDFFRIGPLKMLGDGALGSRTAHLTVPYLDDSGNRGFSLFTAEEMNRMVSYANAHNLQIAIHAIGDACLDQVLDAIELELREHPRPDHRHGVVHCQVSRADQLERIRRLNLHVYAQSIFLDYDNHIVTKLLPPELAGTSYSWKTLLSGGVCVSNGSDCPVELPDVMEGIECAVTRRSLDGTGPYLPDEAFTVQEALDSFTMHGAEASFEETFKGRIAPGYLADFTVLRENPFEAEPHHLHEIDVEACFVGGTCVYARDGATQKEGQ